MLFTYKTTSTKIDQQKLFITTTTTTISRDGDRKKAKFFSTAVKLKAIAYIDGRSQISINAASKCLLNLIASHKDGLKNKGRSVQKPEFLKEQKKEQNKTTTKKVYLF